MKDEAINIYITYEEYNKIFDNNSKQIVINVNLESISFKETLIDTFINNNEYFDALKESLSERQNINIIATQGDTIVFKNTYSSVSIVLAIKHKLDELKDDFKREFMVLVNKIKIKTYLNRVQNKTYVAKIDNHEYKVLYKDILDIILDNDKNSEFMNTKSKYLDLPKHEFIYLLEDFITNKRIFLAFELTNQEISLYKSLLQTYDIFGINKYLETSFKYEENVDINQEYENEILKDLPSSLIEKTIYIYLKMFRTLKYDYELIDDSIVKKHKDLTRIKEINIKNNKVFSYEFSCILAKLFEKLKINFEYNDKYIIARINKYIIKYKTITADFNILKVSELDLLKGITILNENKNSKNEFLKTINSIYCKLYQDNINFNILNMPFNELVTCYRLNSNNISISFTKKYEIFEKLISDVVIEDNAIGYLYEIKTLIFNGNELGSNISFATVAENTDSKINPVVIITINYTNINLYNSNKYIYYNPPKELEKYSLNELRRQFFNGRFKYIKNSKDNIVGLEKSNL